MTAYYNENDPFAAAWLRELIKENLIASGEVDERSIEEVRPDDLRGFTQCHWFAGVGVWSYALRAAGWPDDLAVWTGSCPCQGFSASGKREGFSDKRHLWPAWFRLIRECCPHTIFGEQVSSKDGLAWFDVVSADLENEKYAIGALDSCVAGVGGPHIRQRLYFVGARQRFGADAPCGCWNSDSWHRKYGMWPWERCENAGWMGEPNRARSQSRHETAASVGYRGSAVSASRVGGMVNTKRGRRNGREDQPESGRARNGHIAKGSNDEPDRMGQPESNGRIGRANNGDEGRREYPFRQAGAVNGFWQDAEWIFCRDGKYRPVEPGTFPLASGITGRVGRLRGYGNALCAEQAIAFIESYIELISQ